MKSLKIVLFTLVTLAFVACEKSTNYSKQLDAEQRLITAWLNKKGYSLATSMPADTNLIIGQWYRFNKEGICICIDSLGKGEHIAEGDELNVRYIETSLDDNSISYSYWNTVDCASPISITKGSLINSCQGWDDAFGLMRFSGTIAQIIVPSKLGFSTATSNVKPYHYKIQMRKAPY